MSIGRYVHTLENILINTLKIFDIIANRRDKLIGVWVGEGKIASIGVRVQKGVTKHGFALNVNTDLSYFEGIIPCGIENCTVTSIEQLLHKKYEIKVVKEIIIKEFAKYFK
jgi:lipoate-protein ligase B